MDETPIIIKNELREKITAYLEEDDNVIFALLFGSHAQEKANKKSDIDIAVYFEKPPEGIEILEYATRLTNLVKTDVDLVILNSASPLLRHQVMKHGIRLIIKDRKSFTKFREDTIRLYQDYKYLNFLEIYDR